MQEFSKKPQNSANQSPYTDQECRAVTNAQLSSHLDVIKNDSAYPASTSARATSTSGANAC